MRGGQGGVLAVDKPAGPTSHDVVARARKALGERRVGHTGTLDPFATGLLMLCVGKATRLAEYLTGLDKTYEAVARLGAATDTLDPEGEVVAESDGWKDLTPASVEAALGALRGDLDQIPPAYSAKKIAGEAAHRRVRRGEEVALEPRRVTVHELELTRLELPEVAFRVRCSSGTYVRALARDLGEALGVGAHLTALRRTAVGPFGVGGAVSLEDLEAGRVPERAWRTPLEALARFPRREVDADVATRLAHGMVLPAPDEDDSGLLAVAHGDLLVAVAEVVEGRFRPRKVLASPEDVASAAAGEGAS